MPKDNSEFVGAVLCGGASSRFGQDKATYLHNGQPLAKIALHALLEAGASEVWSIGGDENALANMGFSAVPDDYPGEGPLGGLISALRLASGKLASSKLASNELPSICLVLSCDLPFASASSVREVVAALACEPRADGAVPLGEDDIPQYLHGAWRVRCLSALKAVFADGGRSIRDGIEVLDAVKFCQVSDVTSLRDLDKMA